MCTSTPDVPTVPERQAVKLPDDGAKLNADDGRSKRRAAMIAGLATGPQGVLGAPNVSKTTLGA